ncbi:hypothetical protein ACMT4L_17070 [Deinococcus sp. A31D244]|uniref:hypothetical protein n=1 Tax=Deinococcus sp. A31D244 TaxID=3397675 RepID=UPI0039E19976
MTKLTTPTGLFIGGKWLQPGDAVPDSVPGYDYAKAARKGLIEHQDGEEITNVEVSADESDVPYEPTELSKLRAKLDDMTLERDLALEKNTNLHTELYAVLGGEAAEASGKSPARLALEIREALQAALVQADKENADLKGQADARTAERDAIQTELDQTRAALKALQNADAPAVLPADARDRLIALNGINEKRADEILAVLSKAD